jgi:hypothetical protein
MVLNKLHYDFDLRRDGWLAMGPKEVGDVGAYAGSMMLIRVTEFSHDNKPDIWHKAEILELCEGLDKVEARKSFKKFGLPKLVETTCWAQISELKESVLKRLEV